MHTSYVLTSYTVSTRQSVAVAVTCTCVDVCVCVCTGILSSTVL